MSGPTDAGQGLGLLSLVQWLSPGFPTGGFAYSHGLETAMVAGDVTDATSLGQWISDVLEYGAGWADVILLCHALTPGADLDALAGLARALAPTAERLRETDDLGAAFGRVSNALQGVARPARPLPIALGAAARGLGLPPATIAALFLHGFAASLVSAAVRFVPLGQTEGQQVLAGLHPLILRLANAAQDAPLAAICSATLRADMASARHETLEVRIFRT
ncbi:MAG: urease accessory UreF family protein [Paracoccaceae bacterium]|nr:urease accessory UreF family protein [Paracoccaceae bacterium]